MNNKPVEILLVEDNDDDVVLIKESFSKAKLINVLNVVQNGEEAMAYLRREGKYQNARQPGLVLLDINMPKKSGLEVLSEVKSDPKLQHLPMIMLTSSEREEDIVKSYSCGASSYITKPVEPEKLQQILKQFELYWVIVSKIPAAKENNT